ncbi:unnamed protein product [Prorocentrum cordatum]|uniref:RRM domain-containing protein n=1 Tax=Prorocentrum cordatum TaxID=2364126 RepID=A0ABN9USX2_9DINO|nr:unnamed protein product [Polarella glacialis]
MDALTTPYIHSDDFFDTYVNPHSLDLILGDMCTPMPSIGSLPTMQPVNTQSLPLWQEDHPMLQSSSGKSWKTLDEFDLPPERLRAEITGNHPSEHTQDEAWLGPGSAPSAADVQLSSQPGGVLRLHGQPLPRRQEDHPILQSSGGESWKTLDEFDHPRERRRAEATGSHPSEHAQDSAAPAADVQLSSQPGGVLLLHGQPLPRRQEDHPILQSSGGESWKTLDEFDHPRERRRAEATGSHPSEHAQDSAAPAAAAQLLSQPAGVLRLHGQPLPRRQEDHPILQSSGGESWKTLDEFDHPRERRRAEATGSHPSEHAQDSAAPAAAAQLSSQPAGVLRLHGQPLPRRQEDHPILQSSGGESWKTLDEFDHPRGGAPLIHRAAGAAPAWSPIRPPGMPPLSATEAGLAAGRRGEPGRAARARQCASGGRAGTSSGTPAAGRGLASMQAQLLAQEQLLAKVQQEAQELRRTIREQTAFLEELEFQQGELVDSMPAATEEAAPAAPGVPRITTLVIRNIPMAMTQADLLDLFDTSGFASRYNYVYMPTTFETGTTRGIAFVNFATSNDAREFSILWNKSRLTRDAGAGVTGTVIEVSSAARQGYSESVRMWTASRLRRIKNPKFHPFIAPRPAAL